jgi:low affinity Fe/Cu permease
MKSVINETFRKFASRASKFVGSSWIFLVALIFILFWLVSHFPDKYTEHALLIVDTFCTIVTFLIVFLIQNTQNRHNRAMQLKLDELIKSQTRARNDLLGLEELTDEELDMLQDDFHQLRQEFIDRRTALIKHHISRRGAAPRN